MKIGAIAHLTLAAQIEPRPEPWESVFFWSGVLVVLVVIGAVVAAIARRGLSPKSTGQPDPFTLHGLRQLRARGEITDEEFDNLRNAMIERVRSQGRNNTSGDAAEAETGPDNLVQKEDRAPDETKGTVSQDDAENGPRPDGGP